MEDEGPPIHKLKGLRLVGLWGSALKQVRANEVLARAMDLYGEFSYVCLN